METLVFNFLLATHLGMLRDIRHSSSLSLPVFILLTLQKNRKLSPAQSHTSPTTYPFLSIQDMLKEWDLLGREEL
jgi:hypothetical protein